MRRSRPAGLLVTLSFLAVLTGCGSEPGTAVPARDAGQAPPTTVEQETTTTSSAKPAPGECAFRTAQGDPAPDGKDVGLPPATAQGTPTSVVLRTSGGDVTIALAAKAPCTVRSFTHLAGAKFYDGTRCHRLTTHPALKVLQCGDPTGTGTGGPGYTIPDENPTDLPRSPSSATAALYARGTVAMANTGRPNSGGSQFFMVYGDSTLPPKYAVFGTVDAAGLAVLDRIVAVGLNPAGDPADGTPKEPVTIQSAVVGS